MTKSTRRAWLRVLGKLALLGGLFGFMAGAGSLCFFEFAPPERTCLSCHEIQEPYDRWAQSTHREVTCKQCHAGTLASGIHGAMENLRRVVAHVRDTRHTDMRLSESQVNSMIDRCRQCHPREFVQWRGAGHGIKYADIFLNPKHNHTEQPAEDCLRCHGMFFDGPVGDVLTPLNIKGPWQLKDPSLATRAAIPCLACHQVHVPGHSFAAAAAERDTAKQDGVVEKQRGSLALYSRREQTHFAAADLPKPNMKEGDRPVVVSSDIRQRLCEQCHAPNAFHQVSTSDDRTPVGVHEGLSCAACHAPHSNDTSGSCAQCHPKFSHCGLDVTKMDTTFKSAKSPHNIHFVRCADCHPGGRPKTTDTAAPPPKSAGK